MIKENSPLELTVDCKKNLLEKVVQRRVTELSTQKGVGAGLTQLESGWEVDRHTR